MCVCVCVCGLFVCLFLFFCFLLLFFFFVLVTVPRRFLCCSSCIGGFICGIRFVIVCSSALHLLDPKEGCASDCGISWVCFLISFKTKGFNIYDYHN